MWEYIQHIDPEASGRSVQKRQNSVSWTQLKMRACKSFVRWSGDFEDRVNVLSDDVRALIFQDVGCQTCRDICEERKQCLSFHVRWFSPFEPPDLIVAKPRSSFSGETSPTLASMNTTIHSSHITRWRFQACDRKVRPLGDIIIRAQKLSKKSSF